MKYSYVRVSSQKQHEDRQLQLIKENVPDISDENIFIDKISGKKNVDDRPEYRVLRRVLRQGDELFIDALDRLARNKAAIKDELEYLKKQGVIVRVFTIPTTLIDIEGQAWVVEMINNLLIEVYSTLAEQEIMEKERRQRAGIEAAKKRGVYKGRKPIDINVSTLKALYPSWKRGELKTSEFRRLLGDIKPNTFYRAIERFENGEYTE